MSKDRSRDSHLRLDPWTVWQRVMRVKLSRAAFERAQREHFTYWYMSEARVSPPTKS